MNRAVLSLISGSGKREENIRRAVWAVERLPNTTVIAQSELYGPYRQDGALSEQDCVAVCAVVLTGMSPCALHGACKEIAAAVGREPDAAAREAAVEINLLIYEGASCKTEEMTLPDDGLLRVPLIYRTVSQIFKDGRALDYDLARLQMKTNKRL